MTETGSGEKVIRPPLFFLGGLAIGFGLEHFWPSTFVPLALRWWIGGPLVALSLLLLAAAWWALARHATSIDHRRPTTAIVDDGPYARSRNPVYVSMTLFVAGVATMADSLWVLATAVPAALLVDRLVITREESFLEVKFGAAYLDYKARVRRWL